MKKSVMDAKQGCDDICLGRGKLNLPLCRYGDIFQYSFESFG